MISRSALAFGIPTCVPIPLLVLGATLGGIWPWLALAYLTVFTFAMDELISATRPEGDGDSEFPASERLSVGLAIAHFALLAMLIGAIGATSGLGGIERSVLFLAGGLFLGQVSNSNAHELIHRGQRHLSYLGRWVYISLLFGHHSSAHAKVHHRFVASDLDPNSARLNESYYRFARRAWAGSFIAGLRAESSILGKRNRLAHPYLVYCSGAVSVMAMALIFAGPGGLLVLVGLSAFAQTQLLLSDYVQHYGLRRAPMPDGRLEPVGPAHSWNSPHWFSGHLMLSAPLHSDHHAHPGRAFPDLAMPQPMTAPTLPHSLPVMSVLALFPGQWRRVMNPRVARWRGPTEESHAA
jgi:alkane 1-monooxygenase